MAQTTVISQKILKNNVDVLSPKHTFLATFLLREKNDPNSFWKPYLDLLPSNYSSMPIFFSDEELSWLEGSPFLTQVYDKKCDLKKDYEAIQEVAPEINEYAFEEFCWARMSASSRIFGIVINNAKTDAFVPYAGIIRFFLMNSLKINNRHAEP